MPTVDEPEVTAPQDGQIAQRRRLVDWSWHRIPWTRLGFEFVVIFAAVLLSFIAEDWRQQLEDRRIERRLLLGLVQDLEVDTLFFGRGSIPTDSIAAEAGEWLQANWQRLNVPGDSIARALNGMYRGMAYAPARTEYEAAKSSARLDLIRSAELRRQINNHFEQTHRILEAVWGLNWRFHFEWAEVVRPYVAFAPTFREPDDLRPETYTQDLWPAATLAEPWDRFRMDQRVHATLAQTNTFRRLAIAWQRTNLREIHELRRAILDDLQR
jgi:hypothetical protein